MSVFPINPALEAAVVANADEDTPRLVYADWLDEHGDPDRAEFIRVQIALANISPSDPEWVDLTERQTELAACFASRRNELFPTDPERFYFGLDYIGAHEEPFRRGFPHFTHCQMNATEWTDAATIRMATDLSRLVETTTVRGLHFYDLPPERLPRLLATPAFSQLTGLAFRFCGDDVGWQKAYADGYQLLVNSAAIRKVRHLALYGYVQASGSATLATATSLDAVRRLSIQSLIRVTRLTESHWFQRIQHLRIHLPDAMEAPPAVTSFGNLSDLHTLDMPAFHYPASTQLAQGRFPVLSRLVFGAELNASVAMQLAMGQFPRLAVFEAHRQGAKNDALSSLLTADWFARLRVLNLATNQIGDRGILAISKSLVASNLRILRLGDNPFGKGGLTAISSGAFSNLTTLDIGCTLKRKATSADVLKFISKPNLPRLKHLNLSGWPLGDVGAKALATNPLFAGLTRLDLSGCEIGDTGAKALFASPFLQNLVELRLNSNAIKSGADALADPDVMPKLGNCWMSGNKIPETSATRIREVRHYVII